MELINIHQCYWHVWTDKDGVTHQTLREFTDFNPLNLGEGVSPIFVSKLTNKPNQIIIAQLPKGWVGQWHKNPARQWIIPLSGRWYVETMDGKRVEMGPGEISFGEDQESKPNAKGAVGHLSGVIGNEPTTLMLVQV